MKPAGDDRREEDAEKDNEGFAQPSQSPFYSLKRTVLGVASSSNCNTASMIRARFPSTSMNRPGSSATGLDRERPVSGALVLPLPFNLRRFWRWFWRGC
ncbi:hypothetical protein [Sphingomonas yabuuchiae]|uniref:hypothetical protein n=1 Tax=Sphingomonas yabuuchiae TaxID=172044 RepID=UPI003617C622